MFTLHVSLSEKKKTGMVKKDKKITGEDMAELKSQIPELVEKMFDKEFSKPLLEYYFERDGRYLSGDCDIKVVKNKNGIKINGFGGV